MGADVWRMIFVSNYVKRSHGMFDIEIEKDTVVRWHVHNFKQVNKYSGGQRRESTTGIKILF